MAKRTIALDLDGVLAEMHTPIINWHNRVYGTSLTVNDIRDYDLTKIWGGTIGDVKRKIGEFYQSPEFAGTVPVVGAPTALNYLAKTTKFVVVTARPPRLTDETARFLELQFPGKISETFFTDCVYKETHMVSGKPAICNDIGARLIVEDSAHEAVDCAKAGIRTLLLTRPWNADYEIPEGLPVTRVDSWTKIIKEIRGF